MVTNRHAVPRIRPTTQNAQRRGRPTNASRVQKLTDEETSRIAAFLSEELKRRGIPFADLAALRIANQDKDVAIITMTESYYLALWNAYEDAVAALRNHDIRAMAANLPK